MTVQNGSIELQLEHDTEKKLQRGKRVYKDEDGHRIYLTGDEVKLLDSPEKVKLEVTAVS